MNNTNQDRQVFHTMMAKLRAAYPAMKIQADSWKLTVDAYFDGLKPYDFAVIGEAMTQACQREATYIPSLPVVQGVALELWKKGRTEAHQRDEIEAKRRYLEEPKDSRRGPRPGGDIRNAFDELAQSWWDESRNMGLDPDKPTPREIGLKRLKQFWATWEQVVEGKPECASPELSPQT